MFLLFLPLAAYSSPAENTPANIPLMVDAAPKPGGPWKLHPTRTLAQLPAATIRPDTDLDEYGGIRSQPSLAIRDGSASPAPPSQGDRPLATGFFHTQKINGRWWLVDPAGNRFINKGVDSVRLPTTPAGKSTFKTAFGDEKSWARRTTDFLHQNGFNGTGAWSDNPLLRAAPHPVVYTAVLNFMSAYGKKRGGTYAQPGHTGYPHDCIFVFDPAFETFCDEHARSLAAAKNDPWLLGYFSDNELPFKSAALRNYLSLPENDPGYQAAYQWLCARHGANASETAITPQDETDFLALVADRYFRIVSHAIKKYDPNHLYLGPRLHGAVLREPEVFRAAGPYLDVVAVNDYGAWSPVPARLAMWERESHRPILISEWYAKGADTGRANQGGAGWVVHTQQDRGRFYQNFTLGLLESKVCVGWHWFKYVDDDPADPRTDAANRNSNKGILDDHYQPYTPLLDAMRQLNERVYSLVRYFDTAPSTGD